MSAARLASCIRLSWDSFCSTGSAGWAIAGLCAAVAFFTFFGAGAALLFAGAFAVLAALLLVGADFGGAALRGELFALELFFVLELFFAGELFAVALEGLDLGAGRFFVAMGTALYVVFARTRMPILRVFELYRVFA